MTAAIAYGFRPVVGGNTSPRTKLYSVASNYGTALFKGDPVVITGEATTNGFYPLVQLSTVTGAVTGIIAGFRKTMDADPDNRFPYLPANTGGFVEVYDCTDMEYVVRTADTAFTVNMIGLNACFIAGTGSTTIFTSGAHLDTGETNAPATTVTFPFKIRGLYRNGRNTVGANCEVVVSINNSTLRAGIVGI